MCADLKKAIETLEFGLYFVGDAAYSLHENLLVPFIGANKLDPNKDAFNFHLSELRIRIEMAFGRLVNKFRILKREIEGLIHNRAAIVMACARLHNFIIDMDLEEDAVEEDEDQIVSMTGAPCNMINLPVMLDPDEEFV